MLKELKAVPLPRARGAPRSRPKPLIADRGYDSEFMGRLLRGLGTDPIIPDRKGVTNWRYDDGRNLRRYRRRRQIERLIAWLANFRRRVVRYDRNILMCRGVLHLACVIITQRQFGNQF